MKKISRKGRPRKDAITKLKVMAWFRAVAEASGKTSAQLEREFADPRHIRRSKDKNQEIRPGLWDKYRRGEVEPRARPINENRVSVVQAVEAKYPGTARVLTLPIWKLLDFNQPVTIEELDEIEKTVAPEIRHLHPDENVQGGELSRVERMTEAELPSPQHHLSEVINQWTLKAISARRAMHTQRETIFVLMRTRLEAAAPRRKKEISRKTRQQSTPAEKISALNFEQASLF
jgi:hypothetical protein